MNDKCIHNYDASHCPRCNQWLREYETALWDRDFERQRQLLEMLHSDQQKAKTVLCMHGKELAKCECCNALSRRLYVALQQHDPRAIRDAITEIYMEELVAVLDIPVDALDVALLYDRGLWPVMWRHGHD